MVFTIIIAFISLIGLVILHELGHFILAKKFGVKVEEFGIGYPPRIFGKKIGETIYSLNLLPFGAFVKIYGQEERIKHPQSFTEKPAWQRALIILGGVISFWIIAAILLSIVMGLGVPTIVEDEENHNLIDPKVQIVAVVPGSPAEEAGLRVGDSIKEFSIFPEGPAQVSSKFGRADGAGNFQFSINKISQLQELTERYKGKEITLTIQRGKEIFDISIIPRVSPPENEGAMGVALVRTALKSYPWYQAPLKGISATGSLTLAVIDGWRMTLMSLLQGEGVPSGVEVRGIVGIFELFVQAGGLGISYFLQFIAIISVSLALINILPIPVLDGGWLLLLAIEKVRGEAINKKTERAINSVFFALLIGLMIWVTIKDLIRIF